MARPEVYISVDIETSGPIPGDYSMLQLGAALVEEPRVFFAVDFKPLNDNRQATAMAVNGLDFEALKTDGMAPRDAMNALWAWLDGCCKGRRPVFVGWNSPFDWSFVNYYFHHFVGENPFGFSALDLKSFYQALFACTWRDTGLDRIADAFRIREEPLHNALQDASDQAEIYRRLLAYQRSLSHPRVRAVSNRSLACRPKDA